ncbi:hypothetical protein IC582_016531 [Cucumis melo]
MKVCTLITIIFKRFKKQIDAGFVLDFTSIKRRIIIDFPNFVTSKPVFLKVSMSPKLDT